MPQEGTLPGASPLTRERGRNGPRRQSEIHKGFNNSSAECNKPAVTCRETKARKPRRTKRIPTGANQKHFKQIANKSSSKAQRQFRQDLAQAARHAGLKYPQQTRDRCAQSGGKIKQRQEAGGGVRAHDHPKYKQRCMATKSDHEKHTRSKENRNVSSRVPNRRQ